MNAPVELSVVIVTWNSAAYIRSCLDALRGGTRRPFECLVVDNASGDGTAEVVRLEYPWATLLESGTNRGFAAANNLALRRARGRTLLLLNPDTEVQPGALDALLDLLDRRPRAAAVGPLLLNVDGSVQFSTFRLPSATALAWEYFLRDLRRPDDPRAGRYARADYAREREVEGLLGACFLVRRVAMEQVGLLDERYRMYCEEVDWGIRLSRAGWQLWFTPAARVLHHGGRSAALAPARTFLELQRSRFRLYRRWYPVPRRTLLQAVTRLGMLYQATFWLKQYLRGRLSRAEFLDRWRLSVRVVALRPSGEPW